MKSACTCLCQNILIPVGQNSYKFFTSAAAGQKNGQFNRNIDIHKYFKYNGQLVEGENLKIKGEKNDDQTQ